jgi:hypothetical protein
MIGGNVTERQWQEVEAIVRKEQVLALQHMNNKRYQELGEILDHLYDAAHCSPAGLECMDHFTDE